MEEANQCLIVPPVVVQNECFERRVAFLPSSGALAEESGEIVQIGFVNGRSDFVISRKMSRESKEYAELMLSICLLYTSPSPRDGLLSRMPSSA